MHYRSHAQSKEIHTTLIKRSTINNYYYKTTTILVKIMNLNSQRYEADHVRRSNENSDLYTRDMLQRPPEEGGLTL